MKKIEPPVCPRCGKSLEYVDVIKTHHDGCKWNFERGEYEWNDGEETSNKCPHCHKEVDIEKLTEEALTKARVL